MKAQLRLFVGIIVCVAMATNAAKEKQAQDARSRIGILNLATTGQEFDSAAYVSDLLARIVNDIGMYAVSNQKALEENFAQLKIAFPRHCSDPRCVRDVGNTAKMDRMLFGNIDKNDKTYGVHLTMIDVISRQTINEVSLEGDAGVGPSELLNAAVSRLHGDQTDSVSTAMYFGPQIHHEKEFLYSAAGTIGAGLIWALANGTFKSAGEAPSWAAENDAMSQSGMSAAADRIPMSGRAGGLANCYLALADDAYGVLYNPAGSAWAANREVAASYQYRFGTLSNAAISYVNKATRDIGFGQALLYNGGSADGYQEMYFVSAASYKFNRLLPFLRPLSVGASLKLITKTSDETQGNSSEKTFGMGVNLGLLWELSEKIRYALVFQDLLQFEKVNNAVRGYSYMERQPVTLQMGGLFKAGYTTILVANGQIPLYSDQPWKMAGGLEQELFKVLKVRLGIEKELLGALADAPWIFTGGFGVSLFTDGVFGKYISVDGGYQYNTLKVMDVWNVSMKFGF